MSTKTSRSFARPDRIVLGAAVATLTLIGGFAVMLTLRGAEDFEWGFWPSVAFCWPVVAVGYLLGIVLLQVWWTICNRLEVVTRPSPVLFGFVLVALMVLWTEVPALAEVSSGLPSAFGLHAIAVVLAGVMTVAMDFGYRKWLRKRGVGRRDDG